MTYRTVFAWATSGVALWCTQAELGVVQGSSGVVRVAMLPDWPLLLASVALCVAIGAALSLWRARDRTTITDSFLPLYSLILLVLPYLPWLPDAVPAVRIFAGPGRYFVWLVVVSQVVWAFLGRGQWRRILVHARTWSPVRGLLTFSLASVIVFGGGALAVAPSGFHPGGDEPHYLVMAQSLWRDGDFRIENNYRQHDYGEYYDGVLDPHYVALGADHQIYSIHPIGLPILIAPVYAAGGYTGVVAFLVLVAAIAAGIMWEWVRRLTGSVSAATFAWAATALSVPFAFNAPTVYPEIPAALCVMLALAFGPGGLRPIQDAAPVPERGAWWRAALVGAAAGALPWLSTKYAPMSAALILVALWHIWRTPATARTRGGRAALLLALYAVSLAAWFGYFYTVWGTPSPTAPYGGGGHTQMSAGRLLAGGPGLLFDQEYGVVAYAPALLLGLTGLVGLWRQGGRARELSIEVALVFLALLATVGAFGLWWGGSAVPGRPVASGLLLLGLPVAWQFRRAATAPAQRAVHRLLLLLGLATSLAALTVQHGALLANRRDGISRLLEYFSHDWHLWAYAPDFITQSPGTGLAQVGIWAMSALLCCALLAWATHGRGPDPVLSRARRGAAFLRANASVVLAFLFVTVVTPAALGARLRPGVRPEDRARVALLDSFDPYARPIAVRYDPLERINTMQVPRLVTLAAEPGSRTAAQPVPVLFNARFALPAGRYRVRLDPATTGGSRAALTGVLGLQVGRLGRPMLDWTIAGQPGAAWEQTFDLPVDASFVGFRAGGNLARTAGRLEVQPERVVTMLDRTAAYDVLAAAIYGPYVFLFHDESTYPERGGFWVRGRTRAQVSVVSQTGRLSTDVTLRLRSGPIANTVVVEMPGGSRRVDLAPREAGDLRLSPTPLDGTLRLTFEPEKSFVPAEVDPGSRDRRLLGCWVEVVR